MGGVIKILLALLPFIIGNPELEELVAGPIADFLRAQLPAATDAAIASFLQLLASELTAPAKLSLAAEGAAPAPVSAPAPAAPAPTARAPPVTPPRQPPPA